MSKEFKCVEIDISYKKIGKNVEVAVERKASINFGVETTFADMNGFLDDVKKVIQGYKYCVKNGVFCRVYLSSAVYERVDGPEYLKSQSFNGWRFEGVPEDGDAEGLYLSPDPKYTNEEHDIYIDLFKPLLSQLAEAHI